MVKKKDIWPEPDWTKLIENGSSHFVVCTGKYIYDRCASSPRIPVNISDADRDRVQNDYIKYISRLKEIFEEPVTLQESDILNNKIYDIVTRNEINNRSSHLDKCGFLSLFIRDKNVLYMDSHSIRNISLMNLSRMYDISLPEDDRGIYITQEKGKTQGYLKGRKVNEVSSLEYEEALSVLRRLNRGGRKSSTVRERQKIVFPVRDGLDYRAGRDISEEQFIKDFALKTISFGSGITSVEKQEILNHYYDAMSDMVVVLGLSDPRCLGFNERLIMTFGKSGVVNTLANFQPLHDTDMNWFPTINFNRLNSIGTLAHEYGHALDFMANRRNTDSIGDVSVFFESYINDSHSLFKDVMGSIMVGDYGESSFLRNARLKGDRASMPPELFARAFETFVFDKLASFEISSPCLVRDIPNLSDETRMILGVPPNPFPSGIERNNINEKMSSLITELTRSILRSPDMIQEDNREVSPRKIDIGMTP